MRIDSCRFIDDFSNPYLQWMMAFGDAPMEDCGSSEEQDHPEHRKISEWIRSTGWESPDMKRIHAFIKDVHRKCFPVWYI